MKTTALKSFFFLLSFIFSVCIISTDKQAVANDLVEANAMALLAESSRGILCNGQLFKNCKYKKESTCTYNISPSFSCSISGFTSKQSESDPSNPGTE